MMPKRPKTVIPKAFQRPLVFIFKDGRNYSSDPPMWHGLNQGPIHSWFKSFLETHYGEGPARTCVNETGCKAHYCIRISAEYQRGGVLFRAHHNYRQKGPWYDWARFRWGAKKVAKETRIDLRLTVVFTMGTLRPRLISTPMPPEKYLDLSSTVPAAQPQASLMFWRWSIAVIVCIVPPWCSPPNTGR